MPTTINVKHGNENLVSQSGLLPVGALLKSINFAERFKKLPNVHCVDPNISHGEILSSMLGLICVGKPDYIAIEIFRQDPFFFTQSLGIINCPSQSTLRERIDLIGESANELIKEVSVEMIRGKAPAISPVQTSVGNYIPLDLDVSPFDNSKTKKEGVSRTYKGCDGYAPMFGYLGGLKPNGTKTYAKQICAITNSRRNGQFERFLYLWVPLNKRTQPTTRISDSV